MLFNLLLLLLLVFVVVFVVFQSGFQTVAATFADKLYAPSWQWGRGAVGHKDCELAAKATFSFRLLK